MRTSAYTEPWTILDELMRLQNEFNRFFDARFSDYPPANVWVGNDKTVVDIEVPGIDIKDLEVSVVGNTLSVTGKRETEADTTEKRVWLKRERPEGTFARKIQLPYNVEADKIAASYRNGVLRVTLPRAESDKPRTVQIEAN